MIPDEELALFVMVCAEHNEIEPGPLFRAMAEVWGEERCRNLAFTEVIEGVYKEEGSEEDLAIIQNRIKDILNEDKH